MECNGTTYVGTLEDDLGEIRFVSCDACRMIDVEAWDGHRKSWRITYVDPKTFERDPEVRRKERLLDRLGRVLDGLFVSGE